MGCLWCVKYSRQWKTMPSAPREFIPPFIPVTGMKCSYGKISSPLTEIWVGKTEISGTEPARPFIWTHRKFYKGFRGKARARKPGQPSQPGSYEEAPRRRLKCLTPSRHSARVCSNPQATDNTFILQQPNISGLRVHIFNWLDPRIRINKSFVTNLLYYAPRTS